MAARLSRMAFPVSGSIQVSRRGSTDSPTRAPASTIAVGGATMRAGWSRIVPVSRMCEPIGSTTRTWNGMAPSRDGARAASSPRSPSSTGPPATGHASVIGPSLTTPRSAATFTKFIGGLPMKPPTNRVAGVAYTDSGAPIWSMPPPYITATRSARPIASVWSCVT